MTHTPKDNVAAFNEAMDYISRGGLEPGRRTMNFDDHIPGARHDPPLKWQEGFDAYWQDKDMRRDNPYSAGSVAFFQWEEGWIAASFERR